MGYGKPKDPAVHIMLDLETLGTDFFSPIVQVGACRVDEPTNGIEINVGYDVESIKPWRIDAGTVSWWKKQKKAAREGVFGHRDHALDALIDLMLSNGKNSVTAMKDPRAGQVLADLFNNHEPVRKSPRQALAEFAEWCRQFGDNVHLWTHVGFDYGLIKYSLKAVGLKEPWRYYSVQDMRTLDALAGWMELEREGEHHTALADCQYQSKRIQTQMAHLGISSISQLGTDWKGKKPQIPDDLADMAMKVNQLAHTMNREAQGLGNLDSTLEVMGEILDQAFQVMTMYSTTGDVHIGGRLVQLVTPGQQEMDLAKAEADMIIEQAQEPAQKKKPARKKKS